MTQTPNYLSWPVRSRPCLTCPFAGRQTVHLAPERLCELTENLVSFSGQHFCHSAGDRAICRGGRELQVRLLYLAGAIAAPTDEAFDAAATEYLDVLAAFPGGGEGADG